MARTAIDVDKARFKQAVANAEESGKLPNLSQLYQAVVVQYSKLTGKILTPQIVKARIDDWNIHVQTTKGKKGRQAGSAATPAVSAEQLTEAIAKAEENGPKTNRSELWNTVAELLDIGPATVYQLFRLYELSCQTPIGQKGRVKGQAVRRTSRSEKFATPLHAEWRQEVLHELGVSNAKLVDRVAGGSLKAAIKAMCKACDPSGRKSIAGCTCLNCPLWAFRPYKPKNDEAYNKIVQELNQETQDDAERGKRKEKAA